MTNFTLNNIAVDTKSPVQFFLDYLSRQNNCIISESQVELSVRKHIDEQKGTNSILTCKGKEGTPYYGVAEIPYNRIVTSRMMEKFVRPATAAMTKLSELIPHINTQFGIFLTEADFFEADIDVYDPTMPNEPRYVSFVANPSSFLLVDDAIVLVNPTSFMTADPKPERFYLYSHGTNDATSATLEEIKKDLAIWQGDNQETGFSFLANVVSTTFTTFATTTLSQKSNGDFVFNGNFTFDFKNPLGETISLNNVENILIDINGIVVGETEPILGGSEINSTFHQSQAAADCYEINNDPNSVSYATMRRYAPNGEFIDEEAYAVNLETDSATIAELESILPTFVRPFNIMSGPNSAPMKGYYAYFKEIEVESGSNCGVIARFTETYELDLTFTPIELSCFNHLDGVPTNPAQPIGVHDIHLDLDTQGNIYVMMSLSNHEVQGNFRIDVNGIDAVKFKPEIVSTYAFSPVLKFHYNGALDETFDPNLYGVSPDRFVSFNFAGTRPEPFGLSQQIFSMKTGNLDAIAYFVKGVNPQTYFVENQLYLLNARDGRPVFTKLQSPSWSRINEYFSTSVLSKNALVSIVGVQPGNVLSGFAGAEKAIVIDRLINTDTTQTTHRSMDVEVVDLTERRPIYIFTAFETTIN
jgi:hypothetical protein